MGAHAVSSERQRPVSVAAAPSEAGFETAGAFPRMSGSNTLSVGTHSGCGVDAEAVRLMSTGATLSEGNPYPCQICMGPQELHNKLRGAVRCADAILPWRLLYMFETSVTGQSCMRLTVFVCNLMTL